jgi:hypothetical protein
MAAVYPIPTSTTLKSNMSLFYTVCLVGYDRERDKVGFIPHQQKGNFDVV